MFWLLLVIGLLVAVLEVFASKKNKAIAQHGAMGGKWAFLHRWRILFGLPLAVASAFMGYPTSGGGEQYDVIGIPFLVAAFDSAGRDYVGPLAIPSFVANGLLWLFLPSVLLWTWSAIQNRARKPREQS